MGAVKLLNLKNARRMTAQKDRMEVPRLDRALMHPRCRLCFQWSPATHCKATYQWRVAPTASPRWFSNAVPTVISLRTRETASERWRSRLRWNSRCRRGLHPISSSISGTSSQTSPQWSSPRTWNQSLLISPSRSSPKAFSVIHSHSSYRRQQRRSKSLWFPASFLLRPAAHASLSSSLSSVRVLSTCSSTYSTSRRSLHSNTSLTNSSISELSFGRTVAELSSTKLTAPKTISASSRSRSFTFQPCGGRSTSSGVGRMKAVTGNLRKAMTPPPSGRSLPRKRDLTGSTGKRRMMSLGSSTINQWRCYWLALSWRL